MELIEYLKESYKKQRNIKPTIRIFGIVNREENQQPLCTLTKIKAITLVLSWLVWHGENGKQVELRLTERKEQTVYEVGLLLRNGAMSVR